MGDKTHPQQFRVPPISYPFLNLLPSRSAEGKRVKAGQLQGQGLARSSTGIAGSRARAGAHTRSGDEFACHRQIAKVSTVPQNHRRRGISTLKGCWTSQSHSCPSATCAPRGYTVCRYRA